MIKFMINEIRKQPKEFIELVIGLFFVLGSSIAFTFLMYILFQ